MSRFLSIILLASYFFSYLAPQYITNLYYLFDRMSIQYFLISIVNIIVILVLFKFKRVSDLTQSVKTSFHNKSYLVFLLFALLSLTVSVNITESIIRLSQCINIYLAYILVITISKNSNFNFFKVFIYFTLIALTIESLTINSAVYNSVITQGNFLERSMEFRGYTGNINISSFALSIKLPLLVYLIFKIKNRIKLIFLFLLLVSAITSIILLFSRAALIVISLVFLFSIFYALFKIKQLLILKIFLIISSILLSSGIYSFINNKNTTDIVVERFSTVTDPIKDESVNERLNFYKIAVEDIKENPLLGVGIGNWKLTSIQRANKFLNGYRIPYRVHNDFLEVLAEVGIVGGIFYIFFIFYPFLVSFFKLIENKNIQISFLIFLIIGVYIFDSLFNFPMHRPIILIYLIFTFALYHHAKLNDKL